MCGGNITVETPAPPTHVWWKHHCKNTSSPTHPYVVEISLKYQQPHPPKCGGNITVEMMEIPLSQ
jgi:hypothetical protein